MDMRATRGGCLVLLPIALMAGWMARPAWAATPPLVVQTQQGSNHNVHSAGVIPS
jgi:hypothetical protein